MIARLSRLDESQRLRLGWISLLLGIPAIVVGVLIARFALLHPKSIGVFRVHPRGWPSFTAGQIIAFGGSQFMLFGAAMIWVANQPLTGAPHSFGAFIAWIEFVLLFGVVPSEWLNLSQGPLGWTSQNIAFTIPPWLVLGNEGADQLWCDQGRHLRGLLPGGLRRLDRGRLPAPGLGKDPARR